MPPTQRSPDRQQSRQQQQTQIRVQLLEEDNFNHGKLFRLKQGWLFRLQPSNKIIHKKIRFFCNLPNKPDVKFERKTFYEYEWNHLSNGIPNDEFNKFVQIECRQAGSFHYYFTYENPSEIKGASNFLIDPQLKLSNGDQIDLNSLQLQTVLVKLLGPVNEWESRLQVAKESGYNTVHFTPVQDLSTESNSSYCIRDNLSLNKNASQNGKYSLDDVETVVNNMYINWNMFSICDLVYNHMANDSEFLKKCPNATYNMSNTAHLIPAFIFDRVLYHVNLNIMNGVYLNHGIAAGKLEEHNLESLRYIIRSEELPKHKIEEFYLIDVNKILEEVKKVGLVELELMEKNLDEYKNRQKLNLNYEQKEREWKKLSIVQDKKYRRLQSSIDWNQVKQILTFEFESLNLDQDLKNSNENSQFLINLYEKFQSELNRINDEIRQRIEGYLTEGVNNVIASTFYFFFAHDGPKWAEVTKEQPIVRTYFYFPFKDANVGSDEEHAFNPETGVRIQAHNGWVMGDDPLKNFASEESTVYFRRQLIPWGDSVKLQFGSCPEDNPELWEYMAEYTRQTARIFHGVRLDNCHSTPIHVAQYFLDLARSIRPDLYVIAELFTNSEDVDHKFVTELGITSLIREAMNAWNANELGRLVHRFGGEAVGSFYQHSYRPLTPSLAHAVFYDITHDNQSLVKVHSVYDPLPTSSLVLMSGCAVGSTRGFDELVPHHIDVVTEDRPYAQWNKKVNLDSGIIKAKQRLNKLHYDMGVNGFSQIYVDQFDAETTVVTRHNPLTHQSYILIARTAFVSPSDWTNNNLGRALEIPSRISSVLLEINLKQTAEKEFKKDSSYLNGLDNYLLALRENLDMNNFGQSSEFIDRIDYDGSKSFVHFKYFPPGTVVVFKVELNDGAYNELKNVRKLLQQIHTATVLQGPQEDSSNEIERILNRLTFDELNILLFRCSQEEESEQINSSVYNIPGHGPLTYCGLQGFVNVLEKQRLSNNLGHGFFENLRSGDWMMNYTVDRLRKYHAVTKNDGKDKRERLLELSNWLENMFGSLSKLPRYLIPAYFDLIISILYTKSLDRCWYLMNGKSSVFSVKNGSSFIRSLALNSVALTGYLRDAHIPETVIDEDEELYLSLSAGLPHFSSTYMRNWGRDTFISLRGILLLTNRFRDARNLILSYGSCLRHGLIPNLLGEGKGARFNCRDSVWWWLKAIKDYTELAPNGISILNSSVYRLYPTDDAQYPNEYDLNHKSTGPNKQKLFDIIQEALTVHLNGLKFRERNAGKAIDEHMSYEGFNNEIGVDLNTGFVYGGNQYNCGTWCDKMGSSSKAGNAGYPSSPRDGSAVELVGLSRCVLDWLIKANNQSKYPYDGAVLKQKGGIKFTWVEWARKIDENFEKFYWIGENSNDSKYINQRNMYKDTLNSSLPWHDYQLRPNFLIALYLAPQMINKDNARKALKTCREHLVNEPNTIGIKTLDDSDLNYCGYYDNSNDSTDKRVAHGFNYHQGPEWLWPVGYYLRAELMYSDNKSETVSRVKQHLGKLYDHLNSTDWKSLTELTNKNGDACHYSSPSQAWSIATTLETFYDLANN